MDYIKSWYEYFRGNTKDRSSERRAEELKNELSKLDNNPPLIDVNPIRDNRGFDSNSDIMRIFFGDLEDQSAPSHYRSSDSFWPFGGDMFHNANEFHKEFIKLVNDLHSEFSNMQSFIFQDSPFENRQCSGLDCDESQQGQSLRDYYLRVPDLESIKSDGVLDNDVKNSKRNAGGTITLNGPHSHQMQRVVYTSVGPDGVLEITKITTDSTGKSEKTVTRVDLKDKM